MQIIIVDDEPVSLTALQQLMEKRAECRVQGFTHASTALAWCEINDPDLVLVGYGMPELNGIEFIERFRALEGKARTPVLMVTASTDPQVRHAAFQRGVDDFLNKPYGSQELQTRVDSMLRLSSKDRTGQPRELFPSEEITRSAASSVHHPKADGLLDINMTLQRLAGDEALLAQVARVFIRTVPHLLTAVSAALEGNDIERAYAEAHSLKGAVAVFEAPEVLSSVATLETHAVNYNAAGAAAAFAATRTMVERLMNELSPLVTHEAGPSSS